MNENAVQSIELTHAELLAVTVLLEVAIRSNPPFACVEQLKTAAARMTSTAYPQEQVEIVPDVQIAAQGY